MKDKDVGFGWKWLSNSSKWHFLDNSRRSLCGKWLSLSTVDTEYGNDDSQDNCKKCLEKLKKLRETN